MYHSPCASKAHYGGPRGTKSECGHTLSSFDIRIHIQDALKGGLHPVPSCCGKPLSRALLETVLTKEETDLLLPSAPTTLSSDANPLPEWRLSGSDMSSMSFPQPFTESAIESTESNVQSAPFRRASHKDTDLDIALSKQAIQSFKDQKRRELERVSSFECNQREVLLAHHQRSLNQLAAHHEARREEQEEQVRFPFTVLGIA